MLRDVPLPLEERVEFLQFLDREAGEFLACEAGEV